MDKKAQAAMEFLMTYGWAILVVLVAIGALAYFGVLSPDKFLPERCTGPAGLDCIDKAQIASPKITFVVKNNLGSSITSPTLSSIRGGCTESTGGATVTCAANEGATFGACAPPIPTGTLIKVEITCTTPGSISAGRFKSDVVLSYTNQATGIAHTGTVSITGIAS
jgi:uncharacterized protein (UPF0333 family)